MYRRIPMVVLGVIIAVLIAVCGYEVIIADKKGPVITFSGEAPTYTEGEDKAVLLDGVKAIDKRDGDVSDTLQVMQPVISRDKKTAKVNYAAKDSKNNVTKAYRIVNYVEIPAASDNVQSNVNVQESSVNSDNNSETISNNGDNSQQNAQETTSFNENETINKDLANATSKPVILLNAPEGTITVNGTFDVMSYIKEIYDDSGDVSRRVRVTGEYDAARAGDYQLQYSVSDPQGNVSDPVNFTLHVVEQ